MGSIGEFENAVDDIILEKLDGIKLAEIERYFESYTIVDWIRRIRS